MTNAVSALLNTMDFQIVKVGLLTKPNQNTVINDIFLQLACVMLTVQWTTLAMKMEDALATAMSSVKNATNVLKVTQPFHLVMPVQKDTSCI